MSFTQANLVHIVSGFETRRIDGTAMPVCSRHSTDVCPGHARRPCGRQGARGALCAFEIAAHVDAWLRRTLERAHSTVKAAYMQLAAHVAVSRRPIMSECGNIFGGQRTRTWPIDLTASMIASSTPTAQAPHTPQGMRTNDGRFGSCQVLRTIC